MTSSGKLGSEQLSQLLAKLIDALGSKQFATTLIETLRELVVFNDATILLYPTAEMPIIEYCEPPEQGGSTNLDFFIRGAFLLDPYYLAATKDKHFGFFHLDKLAPLGFKDSEYYNSCYLPSGVHDECGYLIATDNGSFINISIGKTLNPEKFSPQEMDLLASISPVVSSLSKQHWHEIQAAEISTTNLSKQLRPQLQSALDHFGESLLTDRERQIINRILHGYSGKAIAEELSIAAETVKLHRKNAYAKLAINSQSELFHLFIDALMNIEGYTSGDTLENYLHSSATQ